jgi:FAD/FMN-containing dehydrogenase
LREYPITLKLKRMEKTKGGLKKAGFKGELDDAPAALDLYSHDASMFELRPKLITAPKDVKDVECLIKWVVAAKKKQPELSLTARSAGTDMSGGAINESIIVDFRKHFTEVKDVTATRAHAQPGVLYRDFEPKTLRHRALLPSYPASRDLASIGGMVNNNSGGEKSLEFGKTENFVTELEFVFADGIARTVKPLQKTELAKKMKQKDFEGEIYRKLYKLIDGHYEQIQAAKPHVILISSCLYMLVLW